MPDVGTLEEQGDHREQLAALVRSARKAGRKAVTSGRWLADTVVDLAPRIPVRDAATLSKHHDGATGAVLARRLVRSSGNVSAAIGGAAGGIMAVQELSVAGAVAIPFELAAETALVVLVELKLVAELHEVAGRELPDGVKDRSAAVVKAWLSGRGITATGLVLSRGAPDLLSRATRARLARVLRRRYVRNLTTVLPFLTGAAIAAVLNRRATVAIGKALAKDLELT
ncbi:MAG TPA: hypothetical protein VIL36_15560 [Acidimicrobiales bacterium]